MMRNKHKLSAASLIALILLLAVAPGSQAASGPPPRHAVQPGDTLSALAEQYDSTVPAIVVANLLSDPDRIAEGQILIMPPASAPLLRVEVRPGQTLLSIAGQRHTTANRLARLNEVAPHSKLWVGQDLFVPADSTQPSPALPPGPLTAVELWPTPVRQGETLLVRVQTSQPLSLNARLDAQVIPFYADRGGSYWGLFAIQALADTGPTSLQLNWQADAEQGSARWPVQIVDGEYETYHIVLPPAKSDLLDPQLRQAEAEKLAAVWSSPSSEPAWQSRFRPPVTAEYRTSAPFGQRRSYNGGPVNSFHTGQDFAAPEGTPVLAPAAGRVVLAEPLAVRGNAVVLAHGAGLFTGYWHLASLATGEGDVVQPGQQIGQIGSTGLSTGPHLHWEMRLHGLAVDPVQWLAQTFP